MQEEIKKIIQEYKQLAKETKNIIKDVGKWIFPDDPINKPR